MFLIIGGAVLLSACVTIFTGSSEPLTFNSEMSPVKVFIDGQYKGDTPLTLELNRVVSSLRPVVPFEKDGYTPQESPLEKSFNWIASSDIPRLFRINLLRFQKRSSSGFLGHAFGRGFFIQS